MDRKISFVLTSCNRFDLLRPTLESFKAHNSYSLHQFIVIEDSIKALGYYMCVLENGAVRHLGRRRTVRDPKHYRPITRPEKWLNSIKKRWRKLTGTY